MWNEPVGGPQERGLPRAGRTDRERERPFRHRDGDRCERRRLGVGVGEGDVVVAERVAHRSAPPAIRPGSARSAIAPSRSGSGEDSASGSVAGYSVTCAVTEVATNAAAPTAAAPTTASDAVDHRSGRYLVRGPLP